MDKYDVNFKRLALLLLPTFWRRPLFAAMAYAAVSPLQYLHTRFILWKRESDYRLEHNGQVCYLRASSPCTNARRTPRCWSRAADRAGS